MSAGASKDPLHGKTLKAILEELVADQGWEMLASIVNIRCFSVNPSVSSSLKFLRRTPWARAKVEQFYLLQNELRSRDGAQVTSRS
jgi:uncharacterized protein (DUF2132 family)